MRSAISRLPSLAHDGLLVDRQFRNEPVEVGGGDFFVADGDDDLVRVHRIADGIANGRGGWLG